MKKFLCLAILVMALFSCGKSKEGDWEQMKWKTNAVVLNTNDGKRIEVPQSGGTYTFACKNYPSFVLSGVLEDGVQIMNESDGPLHAEGKWSSFKIQENIMTVIIAANESELSRSASITVTAGDIFDYFFFNQKGKQD